MTCIDDILIGGDHKEEVQGIGNHLMESYEGRDLGVSGKLIGVVTTVIDKDTKPEEALYTKSTAIEEMGSFDVRKDPTPLHPGMNLSLRQIYASILGKLVFLAKITRSDISRSVRNLSRQVTSLFAISLAH